MALHSITQCSSITSTVLLQDDDLYLNQFGLLQHYYFLFTTIIFRYHIHIHTQ